MSKVKAKKLPRGRMGLDELFAHFRAGHYLIVAKEIAAMPPCRAFYTGARMQDCFGPSATLLIRDFIEEHGGRR